jgi:hypothetical protein
MDYNTSKNNTSIAPTPVSQPTPSIKFCTFCKKTNQNFAKKRDGTEGKICMGCSDRNKESRKMKKEQKLLEAQNKDNIPVVIESQQTKPNNEVLKPDSEELKPDSEELKPESQELKPESKERLIPRARFLGDNDKPSGQSFFTVNKVVIGLGALLFAGILSNSMPVAPQPSNNNIPSFLKD